MDLRSLKWTEIYMKLRNKLVISILAGLLAMLLYSTPMWWGVLFSPLTQPLTTAELNETSEVVLRFKTLDILFSFLHLS